MDVEAAETESNAALAGPTGPIEPAVAIAETEAWVDRIVIGLNLCPFAKAVQKRRIRYVHTPAADAEALLGVFCAEARLLTTSSPSAIETTLLVHPSALTDFDDYNDFLGVLDAALEELGWAGELQVASFHPDYRFAGTATGDVTNATNRSPWPMLQLLREASVGAALAGFPDSARIYEANIATMQALGPVGWAALQAAGRSDAAAALDRAQPAS
ncbi:MAG: DUF1415 domain-containing protein [Pseudomonadota bacterium]|nr:DUF1415 domain-containing protein [Pseudomonadota bacterium]